MRKYKNSYGSYSSYNNQIIKDKIIFDKKGRVLNMLNDKHNFEYMK
jgi:hypothetical protein